MDRLCQITSSLLERTVQYAAPTPIAAPVSTANGNRFRANNHFHSGRRQRRRMPPGITTSPSKPSTSSTITASSSRHDSFQSKVTQSTTASQTIERDPSRESLISLYCLFQDNMNSPRTSHV